MGAPPHGSRGLGAVVALGCLLVTHGAPTQPLVRVAVATDTPLQAAERSPRVAAWTRALGPIVVAGSAPGGATPIEPYAPDGRLDPDARALFERTAARDADGHELSARLVQLVFKAAYHFASARVAVVSAWRERAGRHTSHEAIDFKLEGVPAARLAAWLRGLPRVGVGVYTHPKTQYVHLDVRDVSYHWLDGSPPGVTWRERRLGDPGQVARDAAWSPAGDLP